MEAKSVDELSIKLKRKTGKEFINLRLGSLSFSIEHNDWSITFDGSEDSRVVTFEDKTNRKSARGKREIFRKFWEDQIVLRYEYSTKSWRILVLSNLIDHVDIMYAIAAIIGGLFNLITWRYLYGGNLLLYYPSLIVLIQVSLSIVPSVPIWYILVRTDYWLERNELVEELSGEQYPFLGFLKKNFSMPIRILLIPLIIYVYNYSKFLNIFPTEPHTFLGLFVDVTPLEILVMFALLFVLSTASSFVKMKALNTLRPLYARAFFQEPKR